MSLVIQSVSPHIGAEVIGADLRQPVGDNLFRELHQAWVDADGLLIVRDQLLTPEQQIAFSRRFGELASAGDNPVIQKYTLPGYPEIFRVSNKKQDGEPLGREDAGTYWHSDGTWQTFPSKASILYGIEIPRVGGNTMFADLYQAWETLTPTMQRMIDGLKAVHAMANAGGTSFEREFTGKGDVVAAKTRRPSAGDHASRQRPQGAVRQSRLHRADRRPEPARERRAAGLPVPAFDRARAGLSPQLAAARPGHLGQSLHGALRHSRLQGDRRPLPAPHVGEGRSADAMTFCRISYSSPP